MTTPPPVDRQPLWDMHVKRVDGSRYLAATVSADTAERAHALYRPDYGFGVLAIRRVQGAQS
jgi:hypothetical protein